MKIDKDIPHPKRLQFPLDEMDIGDSILLKDVTIDSVRSTIYAYGQRNNITFSILKTKDGYRCWRIK